MEGTRLLGLPDRDINGSYGALIINDDTGNMSYAHPNGHIYFDIPKRNVQLYEGAFLHIPVLVRNDENGQPNFAYYLEQSWKLTFSLGFSNCSDEGYVRQVLWLEQQENL
jgi:hypothetical protein